MYRREKGFTLVELITVMILLGIVSVTLFSRIGGINTAAVQGGRDDVIAALFFAQQTAMVRSNIQVVVSATAISVTENGAPIAVGSGYYPLAMPSGVTLSATQNTFTYDKLGRTTAGVITLSGSGSTAGTSATIVVEATGYAHAN